MKRFIDGADRGQSTLFPECVEDWIGEDNSVRVIDVLVDDLREAGRNVEVMWLLGRLAPDPKTIADFR